MSNTTTDEIAFKEISELHRKISRAMQAGRGMRLSAQELDLLAEVGVHELVSKAAAERLKQVAVERRQKRAGTAEPIGRRPPLDREAIAALVRNA